MLRAEAAAPEYGSSDLIGHTLPPQGGSPAYRDRIERQHQSSSRTQSGSHGFHDVDAQKSLVPDGMHPPHSITRGSRPADTAQMTLPMASEANSSVHASPLISGFPCLSGNEGKMGHSSGPSLLGTSIVELQPRKRRKQAVEESDNRKTKRARHNRTQPPNVQRELMKVSILSFRLTLGSLVLTLNSDSHSLPAHVS